MKLRVSAPAMTVQSHLLVNACWKNACCSASGLQNDNTLTRRGTKVVTKLYKLGSLKFICSEFNLSDDVSVSVEVTQWSFGEIRHQLQNQTPHKSSMYLHPAEIQHIFFLLFFLFFKCCYFKHLQKQAWFMFTLWQFYTFLQCRGLLKLYVIMIYLYFRFSLQMAKAVKSNIGMNLN